MSWSTAITRPAFAVSMNSTARGRGAPTATATPVSDHTSKAPRIPNRTTIILTEQAAQAGPNVMRVTDRPAMTLTATVLSSPDPEALADFYHRLLGWQVVTNEPGWAMLARPDGGPGLSFHGDEHYVRPVWPSAAGEQQPMSHLDIKVADLSSAREFAVAQGAEVAGFPAAGTGRGLPRPRRPPVLPVPLTARGDG